MNPGHPEHKNPQDMPPCSPVSRGSIVLLRPIRQSGHRKIRFWTKEVGRPVASSSCYDPLSSINYPYLLYGLALGICDYSCVQRRTLLARALDSALGQTYPNVEIVVVDDGSVDGTKALVDEYVKRDTRVRFFTQENAGVGAARNRAIAESRGEFIAPLDSDDFWYPEKLEKQVSALRERGGQWGMSYCWSKSVNEKGEVTEPVMHWPMEGDIFEALIYRNIIGNASVPLFRASALREVGGYRTRAEQHGAQGCEDWDITVRVAKKYLVIRARWPRPSPESDVSTKPGRV